MDIWLTKEDVQQILGIPKYTLERRMKQGKIAYYKDGDEKQSRVRFKGEDIAEYLKSIKRS